VLSVEAGTPTECGRFYGGGFDCYHKGFALDFLDQTQEDGELSGRADVPILAAADGSVKSVVIDNRGRGCGCYGNYVVIAHANSIETLYGHLKDGSILVREGQSVGRGTKIGIMGSTGESSGIHIHFEFRSTARDGLLNFDDLLEGKRLGDYKVGTPTCPTYYPSTNAPIELIFESPPSAAATSMDDDFRDNLLCASRWALETPRPGFSGVVTVLNKRLEVSVGPGAGGAGVISQCMLVGDFDVQVDYNLLATPVSNLYGARVGGPQLGVGPNGQVGVERGRTAFYRTIFLNGSTQTPTTDTSGSLRLVRNGEMVSGYFSRGGTWILIGSGPATRELTRINLDFGTSLTEAGGATVAFDNFRVSTGTVSC
jgi:hypothetical protein